MNNIYVRWQCKNKIVSGSSLMNAVLIIVNDWT